jgi:phenylacetate-CoA ligase
MVPVFDPLRLSAVSLDVLTAGRAAPGAIAMRQKTRLASLLGAALHGSGFYRDHWGEVSPSTPLAALPVVTRGELMHRFDDWVTDPGLKLAELRAFTADPARISEPYLGRYVVWESSGTSGQPGVFVQDAQAMAVYDALEALRRSKPMSLLRWMDPLYLTERIAFVGATGGHFASHVSMERLRQLNPWMAQGIRSFSILQPVEALVAGLNAFSPTVIATYPSVAALLADEAARGALRFTPREVWTGGETLGPSVRRRVEQALDCTVRNSYGASEFLTMGWECGHGQMHVNADWVILEPVDERYQPVPPGEPSCSTLLTHLANTVQPLIRYNLGDQLTVGRAHCDCGSPLPRIEVQGRRDDPLVMAGLKGQSVTLLPMALTTVLEDQAGVFDFQLRQQDERTLVLRLALAGDEAASAMARCRAALHAFTAAQGLKPIRLIEELGQPVPRGRSGKACRVTAQAV